jgi:hypothetical protein
MTPAVTLRQLMKAARGGDMATLEDFIAAGGDVRKETDNYDNAIVIAAEHGHTVFVRRLLDAGADLRARDKYGSPLLSAAAGAGHRDVVALLLERCSHAGFVNTIDKVKETALHAAARRGHAEVVELLLSKRAKVNVQNKVGTTPLLNAVCSGKPDQEAAYLSVVQLLIAAGADVTLDNDDGDTPLHAAARRNRPDILEALIKAGGPVDLRAGGAKGDGQTPLHSAIKGGALDSIEMLAKVGADMNALLGTSTPFHSVVRNTGSMDDLGVIVQLALHGSDPDIPCVYGGFQNFREYAKTRPRYAQALEAGLAKRAMAKIIAAATQGTQAPAVS